jgi:hypothetical protein
VAKIVRRSSTQARAAGGECTRISIATHNRVNLAWGYYVGATLMVIGGVIAWWLGLHAEGKALEELAPWV